jgi:hypothetical protein
MDNSSDKKKQDSNIDELHYCFISFAVVGEGAQDIEKS